MRASLEKLFGQPLHFPVEVTLASGDRYMLPHPDHLQWHPNTKDLVLYPDDEVQLFLLVINPEQIVSIRPVRQVS